MSVESFAPIFHRTKHKARTKGKDKGAGDEEKQASPPHLSAAANAVNNASSSSLLSLPAYTDDSDDEHEHSHSHSYTTHEYSSHRPSNSQHSADPNTLFHLMRLMKGALLTRYTAANHGAPLFLFYSPYEHGPLGALYFTSQTVSASTKKTGGGEEYDRVKDERMCVPLNKIVAVLVGREAAELSKANTPHCFSIVSKHHTLHFACAVSSQLTTWIKGLEEIYKQHDMKTRKVEAVAVLKQRTPLSPNAAAAGLSIAIDPSLYRESSGDDDVNLLSPNERSPADTMAATSNTTASKENGQPKSLLSAVFIDPSTLPPQSPSAASTSSVTPLSITAASSGWKPKAKPSHHRTSSSADSPEQQATACAACIIS